MAHNYPERSVSENVLFSSALPSFRVQVHSDLSYIGNLKSTIYDKAHIDNYYFVERDDGGFITRLLYLQFEGYLPEIDASYNYPAMTDCKLGNETFMYDGGVRRFSQALIDERDPNSDVAQTVAFLAQNGACFSEGSPYAHLRFVKLLGDPKRDEVLILYLERDETASASLAEHSRESDEWLDYGESLYERAMKIFKILPE